jgi:hypothetical protein
VGVEVLVGAAVGVAVTIARLVIIKRSMVVLLARSLPRLGLICTEIG